MSGVRCVAGAAALERELSTVEGVLHAAVRARRDRVYVEMNRLAPVDTVVRLLAAHGYRVGEGLVRATVWVDASEERLKALRDEVAAWPCVSYFRIYAPTERVDLGLKLHGDWQRALPELCRRLCEARTGDVHNRSETQ